MRNPFREVCNELLNGLDELQDPRYPFPGYITAAMDRARELLAQPALAEPPAEGAAWQAAELDVLRQRVAPVPVRERPWENEPRWLDPDGECWWCPPDGPAYWSMVNPAMVYGGWLLPANAIPAPLEERHHG